MTEQNPKLEWMPSAHAHMKTLDWKPSVDDWIDGHCLVGYKVLGPDDDNGKPTYINVDAIPLQEGQMINFDNRPEGDTGENVVEYITFVFTNARLIMKEFKHGADTNLVFVKSNTAGAIYPPTQVYNAKVVQ